MVNFEGMYPIMGYHFASETRCFSTTNQVPSDSAREKDPEMGRGALSKPYSLEHLC